MKPHRRFGLIVLAAGFVALAAGCTMVSGLEDLEGTEPFETCSECISSSDCASTNCRVVLCSDGSKPSVCAPEDTSEGTDPGSVDCDWASVCH